jgi:hypothetical protein
VCEILTTEANSLPYFQAAWMKMQLTGKATGNMHGIVDKASLTARGLTAQQATALWLEYRITPVLVFWT